MAPNEKIRQLLHDLSTPISVLLLLEDELPDQANEVVKRLRQIIEKYRNEQNEQ